MNKIMPCLWFNDNAEDAVSFYKTIFKNTRVLNGAIYDELSSEASGRPRGSVMTIVFEMEGQRFMALNGGPEFPFTPAISFFVSCQSEAEINDLWLKLSDGGNILMALDKYPFSEKYGWLADKFGVSWQLTLGDRVEKINPFLTFVGRQYGNAGAAIERYTSIFPNSAINNIVRSEKGDVSHGIFNLEGQNFMAMESNGDHHFEFTPAISFMVNCRNQEEIDVYWEKLSEGGEPGQCGWLTDKYGVSWQIVPTILGDLIQGSDPGKSARVMQALLQMTKLDIDKLKKAYESL